mgnify:CR=1 FL=1
MLKIKNLFRQHDKDILLLSSSIATGVLVAWLLLQAMSTYGNPTIVYKVEAPPEPIVTLRTYDCDNFDEIPTGWYLNKDTTHAVQKLRDACKQERNAITLTQIWRQDPTSGVVLGD